MIDFSKMTSFAVPVAAICVGPRRTTGFFTVRLSLLEIRVEVPDPPSAIIPLAAGVVPIAESVKVTRLPAILGTAPPAGRYSGWKRH